MRNIVPLSPAEAVNVALSEVDTTINIGGVDPNKAITLVAQKYGVERHKLETLYIDRGRNVSDSEREDAFARA